MLQILYPILAYDCLQLPICLVTYNPNLDMMTYIEHALSYGKVYRRGEPMDLLSLCEPI